MPPNLTLQTALFLQGRAEARAPGTLRLLSPSLTTHLPSPLATPVQTRVVLDGSPIMCVPSSKGRGGIGWIIEAEPGPGNNHVSFPLNRPIPHKRPYTSTQYASSGHIYVHRDLATDDQQV